MSNISQLVVNSAPQPQDLLAVWSTNNGQPRQVSISALITLIQSSLLLTSGLFTAESLYALRRTTALTLNLTTTPQVVAQYDANGATILPLGGTSLTVNQVTGIMQATRAIKALKVTVSVLGSLPSPRVLTLGVQTGPNGGTLFTSEFQAVATGTGATQCFTFSGVLTNPNNANSYINANDIIQLVASADAAAALTISRATFILEPLDGA